MTGGYLFSEGWHYTAAFCLAVLIIILLIKHQNRKSNLDNLNLSMEEMKNRKRDFKVITKLFNYENMEKKDIDIVIDDQTWQDLEMDKVYREMDFTLTTPGEQKLYELLRKPLINAEAIKKRSDVIKFFQENAEDRNKARKILALLGRQTKGDIVEFIYTGKHKYVNKLIFDILALIGPLFLAAIPFIGMNAVLPAIGVFTINMYIHYKINKSINERVLSISYLSSIASSVEGFCKFDNEALKDYRETLLHSKKTCDVILKNSSSIGRVEGLDILADYFNTIFLVQVRAYYKIMNKIEKSKEDLITIYNTIGELDALTAVAMYKNTLSTCAESVFLKEEKKLTIKNAINPIIIDGVPNTIEIGDKGIILTGSNMSGKSTFLRTIGISAVTAQTLAFVTAEAYEGSIFNIVTSISPKDDLAQGKSYYLGEAEAVLRIIKKVEGKLCCLCIIDEIFRGTNPIERIASSTEILNYIMEHNAICVVATHDLELTELTSHYFEPFYFSENVDDNEGISFDYKIKRGVSPTRNAIKLLKYLGYPEEIIINSQKRLD